MIKNEPSTATRASGMPDTIGRYRIVDRVGKGAMGMVYSAVDEKMDRQVAIKVMMADLEGEPETKARFYREAQAAAKLVHPNIITIFDIGEADGRSFIVMELLRGRPLVDFLKSAEIGLERKLDLMIQLCEGLSIAHANGVFHRDIKPGNIFVLADGLLKVLDFGIARLASSNMTTSGFIVGTPDYMSPEQARGKSVDCRSDIFSAGGVFYFILTGRKPFAAADLPAVLHKVEREDPLPLRESEAPVPLVRVVMKALAKEPERRYQQCQDLLTDLMRFKRYYENETRRIAEGARAIYQGIESLLVANVAAEQALGLTAAERSSPVLEALSARFPVFADRRAEAFNAFPFERSRIVVIADELTAEQDRLATLGAASRTAQAALEAGDLASRSGNARDALKQYERALQAVPSCVRAQEAVASARQDVGRQELREEQIRALCDEATAAVHAAHWPTVVTLCDRILALDAAQPTAARLRGTAVGALQKAEEERVRVLTRLLAQFDHAIQGAHLSDAEQHLRAIAACQPEAATLKDLETRLQAACASAEAADALASRACGEIARARSEFAQGRQQEAIDALTSFGIAEPGAPGVQAEIEQLVTERERLAIVAQRAARSAALAGQAEAALARDDAASAASQAEASLALDGANARATQVLAAARVRLQQAALAAARAATVARHMASAHERLERGAFPKALSEARAAIEADPADHAAAALLAEILERQSAHEAALARAAAEAQRAKAAAPALAAARKAMRAGDYERAGWAAENALALAPEHAEARDLLTSARAAAESQSVAKTDETVDNSRPVPPKTDETVSLTAPETGVARAVEQVGQLATGLWKKIQSNRGQVTTEWVMIAGVFVALTTFLITIFPGALKAFVRSLAMAIRTVAP